MGNDHHHHHHTTTTVYKTDPKEINRAKKEEHVKQIDILKAQVTGINDTELAKIKQELVTINNQIIEEEKLLVHFPEEYNDRSRKIVVLIGNTGDGKSTVGNRLCHDESEMAEDGPFETSDQSQSCTQDLCRERTQFDNVQLCVVDAPGWNDSDGKDRAHANNLCAYLYGSGGINNFVLVRNSANYRFDNNFRMMLERYSCMFGNAFWKHLVVVMTRVESGFAENQFNRGNVAQNMRNHILESFELDAEQLDIPIIAMGMDNYTQALQSIVDKLSDERFECEQIKSPLNELKEEKVQKEGEIQAKVDDLNRQIQDIQDKIDALDV